MEVDLFQDLIYIEKMKIKGNKLYYYYLNQVFWISYYIGIN